MTRTLTAEEIETIRSYPTAEQADADSRIREDRRKKEAPARKVLTACHQIM